MNILLVNKFFYLKGGSERVLFEEAALLERQGHKVGFFSMGHPRNLSSRYENYFVSGVDYEGKMGLPQKLREAGRILYSWEARKKMGQLLEEEHFDIVHLHNIHHQLSPSILDAIAARGIPAVMTLHDYKMVCPIYTLLRDNSPCECCSGGRYYFCVRHRCNRKSFSRSLVNVLEMYAHHRLFDLYAKVAVFASPSIFLRDKLREMGFAKEIAHLPNFIPLADFTPAFHHREKSLVYFGRLSQEKGLFTLIKAMPGLGGALKIIGEGPERGKLEELCAHHGLDNVRFLGYLQEQNLHREISRAMFAVMPSECYENFPLSVLEAFALGKPVVGARMGGIPELVRDLDTGLTFEAGNVQDLREKLRFLLENPDLVRDMGENARRLVEERYNPESHYAGLVEIYRRAADKVSP